MSVTNSFKTFDDFLAASRTNFKHVYTTCDRGDWLCWLFARTNPDDLRLLTLVKAHQANICRELYTDNRSIVAIDTAILFGEGRATLEQLEHAAKDAYNTTGRYAAHIENAAYSAACINEYMAVPSKGEWGCAPKDLKTAADIFRKHIPLDKINISKTTIV